MDPRLQRYVLVHVAVPPPGAVIDLFFSLLLAEQLVCAQSHVFDQAYVGLPFHPKRGLIEAKGLGNS